MAMKRMIKLGHAIFQHSHLHFQKQCLTKKFNRQNSEIFNEYPPMCRYRPKEKIGNFKNLINKANH